MKFQIYNNSQFYNIIKSQKSMNLQKFMTSNPRVLLRTIKETINREKYINNYYKK